jgi:hypothetical protein
MLKRQDQVLEGAGWIERRRGMHVFHEQNDLGGIS